MSAFEERVRGARARQILDDDLFREAISLAERDIVIKLAAMDTTAQGAPIEAIRGVMRLQALASVIQCLRTIMTTGEIAAEEASQG
jgi:hypothetical protein